MSIAEGNSSLGGHPVKTDEPSVLLAGIAEDLRSRHVPNHTDINYTDSQGHILPASSMFSEAADSSNALANPFAEIRDNCVGIGVDHPLYSAILWSQINRESNKPKIFRFGGLPPSRMRKKCLENYPAGDAQKNSKNASGSAETTIKGNENQSRIGDMVQLDSLGNQTKNSMARNSQEMAHAINAISTHGKKEIVDENMTEYARDKHVKSSPSKGSSRVTSPASGSQSSSKDKEKALDHLRGEEHDEMNDYRHIRIGANSKPVAPPEAKSSTTSSLGRLYQGKGQGPSSLRKSNSSTTHSSSWIPSSIKLDNAISQNIADTPNGMGSEDPSHFRLIEYADPREKPKEDAAVQGKEKESVKTIKFCTSKWSNEEDDRLTEAVKLYGERSWVVISEFVGTKSNLECRQRWLKCTRPGIKKGKWSEDEDNTLLRVMADKFPGWNAVAQHIPNRTAKQCRERWFHYVCPNVNRNEFTEKEDELLKTLHESFGNHWARISRLMVGRTENQIRYRVEYLKCHKWLPRNKFHYKSPLQCSRDDNLIIQETSNIVSDEGSENNDSIEAKPKDPRQPQEIATNTSDSSQLSATNPQSESSTEKIDSISAISEDLSEVNAIKAPEARTSPRGRGIESLKRPTLSIYQRNGKKMRTALVPKRPYAFAFHNHLSPSANTVSLYDRPTKRSNFAQKYPINDILRRNSEKLHLKAHGSNLSRSHIQSMGSMQSVPFYPIQHPLLATEPQLVLMNQSNMNIPTHNYLSNYMRPIETQGIDEMRLNDLDHSNIQVAQSMLSLSSSAISTPAINMPCFKSNSDNFDNLSNVVMEPLKSLKYAIDLSVDGSFVYSFDPFKM